MKKIMFALGLAGFVATSFAAVNDSLLMFSTAGVDKYADGSTVLDGECYALCYVTDAATFAIKADGTAAAGGEVLLTAPVAKDGKCPNLLYVVPAEKAESLKGGSYCVYLLDTRVKAEGGSWALAGVTGNKANVVNGAGAVAEGGSVAAGAANIAAYNGTIVAGGAVSVASIIDQPTIKAFNVEGATVKLVVDGLSPAADYKVLAGETVDGVSKEVEAEEKDGTFTVSSGVGNFYKIVGTRKVAQ